MRLKHGVPLGPLLIAQTLAGQQVRPWQSTDYYRLTVVSNPQLSPDGRRVAFVVTTVVEDKDKRHNEIWLSPTDGSAAPFRYTSPSTEASNPVWSPDGSLLAFSSKREGADDDVWFLRTSAPGGEAFQIKGVHATPSFSRDGKWLLYEWRGEDPDSNKKEGWRTRVSPTAITRGPDPKRFDGRVYTSIPIVADERGYLAPRETRRPSHLYLVPQGGGTPRQLTSGELSQSAPAWSPDGRTIAFVQDSTEKSEVRDEPQPSIYLLSVADSTVRPLATGFPENTDPAWSPDGKTIAFGCSKGRGLENDICIIPAAGGTARNLTADWSLDPSAPTWSVDGKTIYFNAETNGNVHLFAVAVSGGPVRQVTTGERQLRGFTISADGRSLAYTSSDITHGTDVYVAPLAGTKGGGAERRLTSFNDSLFKQVAVIPADTFWFAGVGGLKTEGWLMKPYGYQPGKRYPLVFSIHGGPHSNYGNVLFPEFQMLAGQGYWLLFTNPRGSSGYGHDFTYATRGRWGMEDYQDLMEAVNVAIARSKGGIDTTRMAVLGGSYGGFMTNWIVGHTNRFRVAETDRSIFDWYSWYGSSDAQGLTDYEFNGAPWQSDSLYRVLSPMTYASNMRTPMLIVHSEDDKRVPITDAEQLFVSLRKRGIPAEFVRYPRSYHGLSRTGPPWLLVDRLERIRTWFAHWIGTGDTPPAAAAGLH
ncbi:MAG TPA: S9 family peptidase [Gemmatimonadales bacterium]|nr:S9 family peptidase [Gemmatimonadales bacterium]